MSEQLELTLQTFFFVSMHLFALQTDLESNSSRIVTSVRGIIEQVNSRSLAWKICGIHHTVPHQVSNNLELER